MSFSLTTPSNLSDALTDMADFYQNVMGWTVDHNAGADLLEVIIPGKSAIYTFTTGDYSFSDINGGVDFEFLKIDVTGVAVPFGASANWLNPITKMHIHADDSGVEPWSLITFETAPGYFQHVYFGYVEKIGSYDGGAIADATHWSVARSSTSISPNWAWDGDHVGLLFDGYWDPDRNGDYGGRAGGVEIDHVDAPGQTYLFNYAGNTHNCGGGWGNAHNGLLSYVEQSGVDGSINIHPVIIHANLNADGWVSPVGCVPGVRMINCQSFELGQVVTIGNQDWQIFPMCNKSAPYDEKLDDTSGPGNIRPDPDDGEYKYNIGGATERWGIAVLHEA